MEKRMIAFFLICIVLITALSACKRQEDETIDAAAIAAGSGTVAENGKTVVTAGKVSGTSEPLAAEENTETVIEIPAEEAGESAEELEKPEEQTPAETITTEPELEIREGASIKEACAAMRIPDGVSFKMICENGTFKAGMEEYYPDSIVETRTLWKKEIPSDTEEYVYTFKGSELNELKWCTEVDLIREYIIDDPEIFYSTSMEKLGEDGLIVIGKATGMREGHLAYSGVHTNTNFFTLTDFAIEETLFGNPSGKTVRIKEYYSFCNYLGSGNQLVASGWKKHAIPDGQRFLLLLKKNPGQNSYSILHDMGGLPLTDDYKEYDQNYLDRLAGYLNLIPSEWDKDMAESLTRKESSFYDMHGFADQTDRDPKEALEANKDDLLVALAMKYKIKIWPYRSRGYVEAGLPYTRLAMKGCVPDYKSVLPEQ